MAITGRAAHCECCRNTIVAVAAPATRCLDGPASSWRPLPFPFPFQPTKLSRSVYVASRMCPWRSCSGGNWTSSRNNSSSSDAAPFALYMNTEPTRTPIITTTDAHIQGSCNDLFQKLDASSDQERRLGVAGKAFVPPKLLRVGVDVDEVLGSFLASLNTFVAEEYLLQHHVSEYYVYDFMKVWKCSQAEANDRVHAFFESEHFNTGIIPIPGAYQTLRQLASYCHLVVVTSRQHIIRQPTMDWLNQHYSGIFKEVHFGNHFALEGEARSKSEICRSLGVEVLIDDNPRYALECADHGIEVLLFDLHGKYPWSKTAQGPTHPLITRVHNWSEVEQALCALCARVP